MTKKQCIGAGLLYVAIGSGTAFAVHGSGCSWLEAGVTAIGVLIWFTIATVGSILLLSGG